METVPLEKRDSKKKKKGKKGKKGKRKSVKSKKKSEGMEDALVANQPGLQSEIPQQLQPSFKQKEEIFSMPSEIERYEAPSEYVPP